MFRSIFARSLFTRHVFPFLFSALILAPAGAWAQETINYASVSGRVTDPSGAVVEGAAITAVQTDTNLNNSAKN